MRPPSASIKHRMCAIPTSGWRPERVRHPLPLRTTCKSEPDGEVRRRNRISAAEVEVNQPVAGPPGAALPARARVSSVARSRRSGRPCSPETRLTARTETSRRSTPGRYRTRLCGPRPDQDFLRAGLRGHLDRVAGQVALRAFRLRSEGAGSGRGRRLGRTQQPSSSCGARPSAITSLLAAGIPMCRCLRPFLPGS